MAPHALGVQAPSYYVYVIALVAAVGGFLFGYDLSIVSGAILFLREEFGLTAAQEGFAVASAMLGCLAGPLFGSMLADKLGRKNTLFLAAALFFVSAIGTAIPRDLTTFIIFRIVGGVGVGIASIVSPMYIAEIAPPKIRGGLVTMNQLAIVIGSVASIIVAYFLAAGGHWRWMFASECIPIIGLVIGLTFAPESPRWLMQQLRVREATDVLKRINGEEEGAREVAGIQSSLANEEWPRFSELLSPTVRMALVVALGLAILQQITGMSAISFYFPVIFQKAGFEDAQAAIGQNVIVNIWQIFCTILALWLLDKAGRRPLLLIGTLGMAVGLFALGLVFHMQLKGIYVLAAVFLANGMYLISIAPLGWLIMAEIFPNRLRGRAMGVCGMTLWVAAFATTYAFPPLREFFEETYGTAAGAFWLFSGICVVAFLFGWFLVPETKGRTLEEIGQSWAKLRPGHVADPDAIPQQSTTSGFNSDAQEPPP